MSRAPHFCITISPGDNQLSRTADISRDNVSQLAAADCRPLSCNGNWHYNLPVTFQLLEGNRCSSHHHFWVHNGIKALKSYRRSQVTLYYPRYTSVSSEETSSTALQTENLSPNIFIVLIWKTKNAVSVLTLYVFRFRIFLRSIETNQNTHLRYHMEQSIGS